MRASIEWRNPPSTLKNAHSPARLQADVNQIERRRRRRRRCLLMGLFWSRWPSARKSNCEDRPGASSLWRPPNKDSRCFYLRLARSRLRLRLRLLARAPLAASMSSREVELKRSSANRSHSQTSVRGGGESSLAGRTRTRLDANRLTDCRNSTAA